MKKIIVFFGLLLLPAMVAAQEIPWEPMPAADASLERNPWGVNQGAIILFKRGFVRVESHGISEYTTRRVDYVRMKILNERGLKYATVEIPYFKGFQRTSLVARTITPSGEIIPLAKEQIFQKSVRIVGRRSEHRVLTFAFPSAEKGAVLEYQFTAYQDTFVFIEPYVFDGPLFAKESSLEFSSVPRVQYQFAAQFLPGVTPETSNEGTTPERYVQRWRIRDLSPLPEESYRPPTAMVASRIAFVATTWGRDLSEKQNLVKSWDTVAEIYYKWIFEEFGRNSSQARNLAQDVTKGLGETEAIDRLYRTVQEKVRSSSTWGIGFAAQADELLKQGHGDGTDRNLLLTVMLRAIKLKAWPVLAATKEHSNLPESFPSFSEFDRVICYVEAKDGPRFLDASDQGVPSTSLPPESEGIRVLLAQNVKGKLMTTPTKPPASNKVEVQAALRWETAAPESVGAGGQLPALRLSVESMYSGHDADDFRAALMNKPEQEQQDFLKELVGSRLPGTRVESVKVSPPDAGTLKLNAEARFPALAAASDRLLLKASFWTGLNKSPFSVSRRFTPIMFSYPYEESETVRIPLPAGYQIEEAPQDAHLEAEFASYDLKVVRTSDGLELRRKFNLKQTVLMPDIYDQLRNFYAQVVKWDTIPIIFGKKGS